VIKKILDKLRVSLHSSDPIEQEIVGIDLSHDYVRAVQLNKKQSLWTLSKLASKTVSPTISAESKEHEIVRLLKTIRLEQKFSTENAAISLPISSAIVQVIQIPYLEDAELNVAVENGSLWESSINLPGELSEYSIFWQVVKRNAEKNQLSILFVASRIDEIEKMCDLVRKAGFDPLIVDVRCFALRNILKTYSDVETNELTVFLEISGHENYIVFIYDDLPFIYDVFVTDSDASALITGGGVLDDEVYKRIASQVRTAVSSFINQSGAPGIERINIVSSLSNFDVIADGLKKEIVEYRIQTLNPLSHLNIPLQMKSRVEAEKNASSLTVALGLATRRLDIFGYFKFVKAVANINLLPNREEIVKKEKEKSETKGKLTKVAFGASAVFAMIFALYGYLLVSFPSQSEIDDLQTKIGLLQTEVNTIKAEQDNYQHWVKDVIGTNEKILDISYLSEVPNGVYVIDLDQRRKESSLLTVKSNDQSLVSNLMTLLSANYKNVKLMGVESTPEDFYQTSKISYQVK
jgi:type IV pilus assembly protein PilN